MQHQTTLGRPISLGGMGLHTGEPSVVRLRPAPPGHGILFRALGAGAPREVAASWENRTPSQLCTALRLPDGGKLRTVEHLMASLLALRVDNVLVEVEGREIPILDGSAKPWCREIAAAGLASLDAPRRVIKLLRPIEIRRDGGFLRAEPEDGFRIDVTFDNLAGFGVMRWAGEVSPATFRTELAAARSFGRPKAALFGPWRVNTAFPAIQPNCPRVDLPDALPESFWNELAAEKAAAQAEEPVLRGARPGRVAVVLGNWVLGGRRYPDEPVRHVALDMIGDLALAGGQIRGRITAHVPSHEKTWAFVHALMSDHTAYERIIAPDV